MTDTPVNTGDIPTFPWEQDRDANMSDVLADWIDSRANDTFLYWHRGRLVRYSESNNGRTLRVWWDKVS